MKYKEIDGMPTPWEGKHESWYKRLIYKLYVKYVNDLYIPDNAEFFLKRAPRVKDPERKIDTIQVRYGHQREKYIFNMFNKISTI